MWFKIKVPSAADILCGLLIGILLKGPISLASNAVTGWIDNAIAEYFGWTSPSVAVAVDFLWRWVLPFAAAALILIIYHYWNSRSKRRIAATRGLSTSSPPDKEADPFQFDEHIPDVRVADSPAALSLFDGPDGDRLIPLLEAEKISAWARPIGRGEPAPIKVPGIIWRTHQLVFFPRNETSGTRNQTFVKTKLRGDTAYYDLHLNRMQIRRVWPNFEETVERKPRRS